MYRKISTGDLCRMAIFVAVIAICAQIAIPMPGGVPMTLQTWAISLAAIVLGTKNGTMAVLVYILLGVVGAPVFAGFAGGLGIVFGATGGFIISFPLMALAAGIGANTRNAAGERSTIWLIAGLILGTVANFVIGMLYFSFVMGVGLQAAFAAAVLPFIPSALLRIALLPAFAKSISYALNTSSS
ncbi:MAG: biotin transporter BioY [Defluviitaleaceae bacterium]|nr:biotin transporter BioY [Defluviitaleaceae bacterium]